MPDDKQQIVDEFERAVDGVAEHLISYQTIKVNSLESPRMHKERVKMQVLEELAQLQNQFDAGLMTIVQELKYMGVDQTAIDKLTLTDEMFERLHDDRVLQAEIDSHKSLAEMLGIGPESLTMMFDAAASLDEQGSFNECIDACFCLTVLSPQIPAFWMALGTAYYKSGRLEDALQAYENAVGADPAQVDAYIAACRCCLELKQYDEGIRLCHIATELAADFQGIEQLTAVVEDAKEIQQFLEEAQRAA